MSLELSRAKLVTLLLQPDRSFVTSLLIVSLVVDIAEVCQ
jgi:hypothetical protein